MRVDAVGWAARRPPLLVAGLALAVVSAVALGVVTAVRAAPAPTPVAVAEPAGTTAPGAAEVRAVALRIPDIGLEESLADAGVDGDGVLVPPEDPAEAAWFTGSAVPGDTGPSVVIGHVDSRSGPGVFARLDELDPGDRIEVLRSDGRAVDFRVVDVVLVDKDEFPTDLVYGPVPVPELRLITCGGDFDRARGHYVGNVVVTAVPLPTFGA